jgi:Fe-Mn family superoxide dismutase
MTYTLPSLPYAYDALAPHIDALTMEIHHTKHHQAYITKLNEALDKHPELKEKSLHYLLTNLDSVPEDVRTVVRNNGGGHLNHSMFWELLSPTPTALSSELESAIVATFGSVDKFKEDFVTAALTRFGSGWSWLSLTADKKLVVHSTANQDSPIMEGLTPLLGLDVWEHAYYLNYQNRRPDYAAAFWNVVNFEKVSTNYSEALNK